jgi:hypothetical protein
MNQVTEGGVRYKFFYRTLIVLVFLAASLLGYAGSFVSSVQADYIMYSIMSTQNVTLFYWGQNRFLNIIPFLASPISDHVANISLVLFLSVASHYLSGFAISVVILRIIRGFKASLSELAWLALSTVVLMNLLISPNVTGTFFYQHEYSLAFLLISTSWLVLTRRNTFASWVISSVLLFLAMGLNPTMIVLVAWIAGLSIYFRVFSNRKTPFLWASVSFVAVSLWFTVMASPGMASSGLSASYVSLRTESFFQNSAIGFTSLIALVEPVTFMMTLLLVLALLIRNISLAESRQLWLNILSITVAALIFLILWVLVFSSLEWVVINKYSPRYFIPPSYLVFGLISSLLIMGLYKAKEWLSRIGVLVLFVVSLFGVISSDLRLDPRHASVFESLPALPSGSNLLAGDYWKVWPMYFLLLDQGSSPISFAYRGAQGISVEDRALLDQFVTAGSIRISCLNSTVEECVGQVQAFVPKVDSAWLVSDAVQVHPEMIQIDLERIG